MTQHKRMVQTRKCAALTDMCSAFTGERCGSSRIVKPSHLFRQVYSFEIHHGIISPWSFTLTYVITYRCQGCEAISMTFYFYLAPLRNEYVNRKRASPPNRDNKNKQTGLISTNSKFKNKNI
jgi:hypothetical protein